MILQETLSKVKLQVKSTWTTMIESLVKTKKLNKKVIQSLIGTETKIEEDMAKMNRHKTRYHKILFVRDAPYRAQVIANKKKKIPRDQKYNRINTLIED